MIITITLNVEKQPNNLLITLSFLCYFRYLDGHSKNKRKINIKNSSTSIKIPLVWQKGSVDEMTIKVEPMDTLDWENQLSLIDDLKEKMGLIKKKIKKSSAKLLKKQKRRCVICREIIKGRTQLVEHYLVHKEHRIKANTELIQKGEDGDYFCCCICMKEFVDKIELDRHANVHVERPYFCEICTKSFKLTQNFLAHMGTHEESKELHKCDNCDFESSFKLAYDKHIRSHSREEYRCELCNKTFPARTWFVEHKNFHTGERPFSCEECGKCFPYSRYLTAHKKSMHPHCYFKEPELNECNICKKRYSHKNSLRLHMKSHTGENIYLCDICGKSLSSTDKLQLHKRIHTGYKPYSCNICEKAFTKKDILTDHLRVHSGEKPFACETCGKCFSQRSPLTIHKRYHTGERPYVCHLCNKGFVSKGILGIHLKQGKH